MQGKVQLRGDVAVGHARCDQVDHPEPESVRLSRPVLACVADDATGHTEPVQLAANPARIGERFVVQVGVECGVQLIDRLVRVVGACEFAAGVLGSRGVSSGRDDE